MYMPQDKCDHKCGIIFEPFWDQCGEMLTVAGMGGMDEMGIYYDHCLESLYPPGACVSLGTGPACRPPPKTPGRERYRVRAGDLLPVSYTHLTLPTILRV